MRRIDLINAVNNIGVALNESKILKTVASDKVTSEDYLNSYEILHSFAIKFGEAEKKVFEIFGFDVFLSIKYWAGVIGSERTSAPVLFRKLRMFLENLPALVDLLKQDNVFYSSTNANLKEETPYKGRELLTIILPENQGNTSHPERLIKALEAINILYKQFDILNDTNDTSISVVAIDSGSDKSFDFVGVAKLMQEIKEFIISLWERVVFYRERQMSERLDLITKSLPILERISEMQASTKISPEQAELLKRNIISAAGKFISAGAIIPELDNHSTNNPRLLLTPEPKLLNSSNNLEEIIRTPDSSASSNNVNEIETFTPEELKKIKDFLNGDSTNNQKD